MQYCRPLWAGPRDAVTPSKGREQELQTLLLVVDLNRPCPRPQFLLIRMPSAVISASPLTGMADMSQAMPAQTALEAPDLSPGTLQEFCLCRRFLPWVPYTKQRHPIIVNRHAIHERPEDRFTLADRPDTDSRIRRGHTVAPSRIDLGRSSQAPATRTFSCWPARFP